MYFYIVFTDNEYEILSRAQISVSLLGQELRLAMVGPVFDHAVVSEYPVQSLEQRENKIICNLLSTFIVANCRS